MRVVAIIQNSVEIRDILAHLVKIVRWEGDISIDFNDSHMNYLGLTRDKALDDSYTLLTYVNDTEVDQDVHVLINPFRQSNDRHFRHGEYIVEFRR